MHQSTLARTVLVALALAGLVLFYAPYLSPRWAISPWGDTIYLTGPLFCEISRSVKAAAVPLMNWSTFEAIDFNPHVAPYYPFYLFNWLDFCSPRAAAQAADTITVLHMAIFAMTMTSLIRATGAGFAAAFGGASLAVTLPNTFTIANFPTFITVAAWLPMAFEGLLRIYYRRDYLLGILVLAIGTSAMLTAGPGTNLLSALVLVGLIMTVERLVHILRRKEFTFGLRLTCGLAAAAVITILLSLASTINLFGHIGEIIRWTRMGPVIGKSGAANVKEILTEQLTWQDLPQLLTPISVNYAVGYYLLGPAAVLLALAGVVSRWSQPAVRVFATVVAVCVIIVFLSPARLVLLWTVVPGLSHTRHLSLVATPLAISIGVLAGQGLAAFSGAGMSLRRSRAALWAAGFVVLLVSVAGAFAYGALKTSDAPSYLAVIAMLTVALFAAIVAMKPGPLRQWGAASLIVLQMAFVHGTLQRNDGTPAVAKSELWRSINAALERIRASDPDSGRIALHPSIEGPDLSYLQAGSAATYMEMLTFSHYTSPRIYWKFVHEIGLAGDSGFAGFGGKYLLSIAALPESLGKELFRVGDVRVYLLDHRRPFVASLCLKPGDLTLPADPTLGIAPAGQLPLLNPTVTAAIEALRDGHRDCPSAEERVGFDRRHSALDFAIPPGQERLLVISVPPYESWQLSAGGRQLPLYNLKEQQIVAAIPSDISGAAILSYRPARYRILLRISQTAWVLAILALAGAIAWRWRHRAEPAPAA